MKKIMDYLNNYYCSENNKKKNKIYESLNLSKQTKTKHVSVMEKIQRDKPEAKQAANNTNDSNIH